MRKAFIIILCIVILIGVGVVILNRHLSHIYGPGYDPSNSGDLQKLLAIADGSRPLREALERFKNDRGDYPMMITNLFPSYLQTKNAPEDFNIKDWAGWEYHWKSTNSYELFYQLDWDGELWFEHSVNSTNQWSWSTSDRVVDLTQKFQH